jgi:hypothetical protein
MTDEGKAHTHIILRRSADGLKATVSISGSLVQRAQMEGHWQWVQGDDVVMTVSIDDMTFGRSLEHSLAELQVHVLDEPYGGGPPPPDFGDMGGPLLDQGYER